MRIWNNAAVTRLVDALTRRGGPLRQVDFRQLSSRSDLAVGLAGWRNTDWRARRSYRFAMQGFDVRERLGAVTAPAIVLHGARDVYFSPKEAFDLARRLPRGELRLLPTAAHTLPLTHGAEVVQAVQDLLTGETP
jgi:pimeloyl-ACP methyl ester carboxylesterase